MPPAHTRLDPRSGLYVGEFSVQVSRDGTYDFAMMTVFTDGTSSPMSVDQLRRETRRTIDTRPPDITLKPLQTQPRSDGKVNVGIEWKIEDENLVRNSIRLEGRWYGAAAFRNFAEGFAPEESGRQEWKIPTSQRMEIRLSAADRAGNLATKTILLGSGVGTMTGSSGEGLGPRDPLGRDPGPVLNQPPFRLVNSKTIHLQYRLRERPPSGLAGIELWVTRLGNEWQKYDKPFDAPAGDKDTAAINFEAGKDGLYGFVMIATSNAGIPSQLQP